MDRKSSIIDYLQRKLLVRRVIVLVAHVVLYTVSYLFAFLLRFDFTLPSEYVRAIILGGFLIVFLRTGAGFFFRLYGGVLKYAGINDLVDIIKAMTLATAAFVVAIVLLGLREIPRSVIAIDWIGSILFIGGLRFGLRLAREALTPGPQAGAPQRRRVGIVGAGDAGENLVRDLLRTYRDKYEVVGFFDDNPSKRGLRIHDIPVMAPVMYLGDFVPRYRIDEIIIAIPTATGETMRRIVSACKVAGVRFKTVPGIDQLIDGTVSVNQVRDVAIEDLLGREPVHLEEGLIRKFIHQKIVMVTGAGGSIGAELCRQILRYQPRKLVLLDQSEPNLFFIHHELAALQPEAVVSPVIADVIDRSRMERVFTEHGPEVIFHAAAHKHVPMMEWNPGEAVKNNVFGTRTVADLAHQFGALAFVFISTDKAVNPTSVMGASKRVAEMYVQALSVRSKTKFTAVRFGNVLGSVGSVVPIFKEQIAKGGPVTVTDPDMRRYFMTIPESCQLVMQSAAMGEGGEIFVLDMGEPVKIVDLARDLITLSGFEPDKDIRIVYSGVRPGEKLFEEIGFNAERMDKTRHPKIYTGKLAPDPLERVEECLGRLGAVMNDTLGNNVRVELKRAVPEFQQAVPGSEFLVPGYKQEEKALPAIPEISSALPTAQEEPVKPAPLNKEKETHDQELETKRVEPGTRNQEQGTSVPEPGTRNPEPGTVIPELETRNSELGTRNQEPSSTNSVFDPVWEIFTRLCKERGFSGAGWKTMGVEKADRRHQSFDDNGGEPRSVLTRSVAITALAFVELRFIYPGRPGKKVEPHIKQAVRDIAARMARELAGLHRVIESKS